MRRGTQAKIFRRGAAVFLITACSVVLLARAASADVVVLKDGTRLEGKVKVQELGKYVVIELPNGVQKTVMWDALKEIEVTAPPAGATPPAGTPPPLATAPPAPAAPTGPPPPPAKPPKYKKKLDKTAMAGEVTAGGVHLNAVHECGEGEPACREEVDVQVKGTDIKATYEAVEDCSSAPGEVCVKKTTGSASSDGLKLGYSKESATRVTGPKKGAAQFGLEANFLYGSGENLSMLGFTAGANLRLLTGGLFPGESGGSWLGFFLEPTARFAYTKVTVENPRQCIGTTCFGGEPIESNSSNLLLQAGVGLQYMSFGVLDKKTLQQTGYGIALGPQIGAYIPLKEGETTVTYGAGLNLIQSKYNPGTGSFNSESLNIFILPTSDLFLLLIGAQKSWG